MIRCSCTCAGSRRGMTRSWRSIRAHRTGSPRWRCQRRRRPMRAVISFLGERSSEPADHLRLWRYVRCSASTTPVPTCSVRAGGHRGRLEWLAVVHGVAVGGDADRDLALDVELGVPDVEVMGAGAEVDGAGGLVADAIVVGGVVGPRGEVDADAAGAGLVVAAGSGVAGGATRRAGQLSRPRTGLARSA